MKTFVWQRVCLSVALVGLFASVTAQGAADTPSWLGLSSPVSASGASLLVLRRQGAPTLALCVRSLAAPSLRPGATPLLRDRGGSVVVRNLGDSFELCLRLPAHELSTAAWAVESLTAAAQKPRLESSARLRRLLYPSQTRAQSRSDPFAIALVGDVDLDDAVSQLRPLRTRMTHPAAETAPGKAPRPALHGDVVLVGWRAAPRGSADRAAMEVAAAILATQLSQLDGVQASPRSMSDIVFLEMRTAASQITLQSALNQSLAKLGKNSKQLSIGRNRAQTMVLQELDDNIGIARALLDGVETRKQSRSALRHVQLLSAVDAEAVQSARDKAMASPNGVWLSPARASDP